MARKWNGIGIDPKAYRFGKLLQRYQQRHFTESRSARFERILVWAYIPDLDNAYIDGEGTI